MIEIRNLKKEWKKGDLNLVALEDISLSINKGEFVSIIGPSGCGKTTLLRIVAGLVGQTSGVVSVKGDAVSVVFQNPVLLPWRNVYDNVKLAGELNGGLVGSNVLSNLRMVGLEDFRNHFPHELSGGMQQRVSIARALLLNPSLLLMDEPFGALDELNRNKLNMELLRLHRRLGVTVLFVTHSISEAVFLSDKVVILSDRPARVKEIVSIGLPRVRSIDMKETKEFQEYVKCIREKIRI